jgi:CDP-diacylglycerol pyrophosphatase
MTCYSCGSSPVGEQKIRNYKNGNTQNFVYYHCSCQVDRSCKELYATEANIIEQLSNMCNDLMSYIRNVEPNLRVAINKFAKMMSITNGESEQREMIGSYIKYVLHNGTQFEKTRLVRNLDAGLALHERRLVKQYS